MFTIRIDRGRTSREVFSCARYIVGFEGDGAAKLTLVGVSDGKGGQFDEPQDKLINAGDCAFVMNEKGITCDVVRAQRAPAAAGGG